MSEEISFEGRNTLSTLATAWENEDVEATFQAQVSDDGIVQARGVTPLKRAALLELSAKNLIRVSETGEGQISVKLLPALNRAMDEQRAADKERAKEVQARMRSIIRS